MLYDGERMEQEFAHARDERLHLGQGALWSLVQAIIVRPQPGVVLNTRERSAVHDGAEIIIVRPAMVPRPRREGLIPASLMSWRPWR